MRRFPLKLIPARLPGTGRPLGQQRNKPEAAGL